MSTHALAVLSAALVLVAFLADGDRRPYAWGYGAAAVVIAPYLLALLRERSGLAGIVENANPTHVAPLVLLAFYAPYLVAAAFAIARAPDRLSCSSWSLLATTLLLAGNHLWSWSNHPYRFAIHLLFPFALLSALGLRHAPGPVPFVLAAWFAVGIAGSIGGSRGLAALRRRAPGGRGHRRLPAAPPRGDGRRGRRAKAPEPPEFHYPLGLTQDALIFNYSASPGFIPDYRYLLARERYYNRLALFCFLFPGYPAYDQHLERRACTEPLDPPPSLLALREPRLRTALLPAYRIAFAAASGKPFGQYLEVAQNTYGWTTVAGAGLRRLVRTPPPGGGRPGAVRGRRRSGPLVPVRGRVGRSSPPRARGPWPCRARHRGARGRPRGSRTEEGELGGASRGPRAGPPPPRAGHPGREGERDLLYFAAIVSEAQAGAYLALPPPVPEGVGGPSDLD